MSNPCKERYDCTECCKDALITMSLQEFGIFAQAWIAAGAKIVYVERKSNLANFGIYLKKTTEHRLYYAANHKLSEHLATGKFGNTQVVAVFAGLCMNNDTDSGYCNIQDTKPKGCSRYVFDGADCRETRNENNILPKNFIPISEIN